MKRTILALVALVLITSTLLASNYQKTYLMSDAVWQKTNRLCIMNGVLGPTPVSPTSGENILRALKRLKYNSLSARDKRTYDEVMAELNATAEKAQYKDDEYAFRVSFDGALEAYAFNNTKSTYYNEFFLPYKDRPAMVGVEAEILFGDNLYLDFRYDLQDNSEGFYDDGVNFSKHDYGYYYNFSNFSSILSPRYDGDWDIFMVQSDDNSHNMFNHTPLKAGASFGNRTYNFFIGRNRQAFGNGQTGNLVIGDNFPFQEFMKFEASSDFITYELSITHFDNTQGDGTGGFTLNGEHQNRTMQRIDLNFSNRLRLAMNLGGMFNTDSPLDWRLIMPMAMVHNWVNNKEEVELVAGDEGNNIMGFELEYVIRRGLFASAQIVIDQFQLAVEEGSTVPNAVGLMANITKYDQKEHGLLESQAEFIYTSPFLYLNTKYRTGTTTNHYGYDWIVGYAYDGSYSLDYSGHPFGPGTVGINLRETYYSDKGYQIAGNLLYRIHGNKGINYGYKDTHNQNQESQGDIGCSSDAMWPTGYVEHTLRFDLGVSYPINEKLTARVQAASISQWNYHNVEGEFKQSIQGALGIRWVQ